MSALIYVLCYDDTSEARAVLTFAGFSWAKPLRIRTTRLFEAIVFVELAEELAVQDAWHTHEYIGFLSHKAFDKFPTLRHMVPRAIDALTRDPTPDAFSFAAHHTAMRHGDPYSGHHPQLRPVWESTLTQSFPPLAQPFRTWFCNYWCARPSLVLEYSRWLRDAFLPVLLADARVAEDAHWSPPTQVMHAAGLLFYDHVPFIAERVVGAWFENVRRANVRFEL